MSPMTDFLEDFDVPDAWRPALPQGGAGEPDEDPAQTARDRLAAYEDGYRSGWDDATNTAREARTAVSEELARNLQDIGFTYFEARNEVLASLDNLLGDLFHKLFPSLRNAALIDTVREELREAAETSSDIAVVLRLSPEDAPALGAVIADEVSFPFEIREEDAVAAGQAYLDLGLREARIDVGRLIDRIGSAVEALSAEITENRANG